MNFACIGGAVGLSRWLRTDLIDSCRISALNRRATVETGRLRPWSDETTSGPALGADVPSRRKAMGRQDPAVQSRKRLGAIPRACLALSADRGANLHGAT